MVEKWCFSFKTGVCLLHFVSNNKDSIVWSQTNIPTDSIRNSTPKPRNSAANKLINSSLKTTPVLGQHFGRDTSKTKNQDVKNVPMISKTAAKCGNTDGLMGDTYRVRFSIVWKYSQIWVLIITGWRKGELHVVRADICGRNLRFSSIWLPFSVLLINAVTDLTNTRIYVAGLIKGNGGYICQIFSMWYEVGGEAKWLLGTNI